jgi:hypothetical protein
MSQSVIIQFNFCPTPINKNNIVKINCPIEDTFTLKDALIKAIKTFNKQSSTIKLVEMSEKYKIKLSKKSGLPDMDLPGNNSNFINISN